jgi:hypothetical protein
MRRAHRENLRLHVFKVPVLRGKEWWCMWNLCNWIGGERAVLQMPWCWQCGAWGTGIHHVYQCNAAPAAGWGEISDEVFLGVDGVSYLHTLHLTRVCPCYLFFHMQRWDFYHQRYANHADSLKFADGQLARAVGLCADVAATKGAFVGAAIVRYTPRAHVCRTACWATTTMACLQRS